MEEEPIPDAPDHEFDAFGFVRPLINDNPGLNEKYFKAQLKIKKRWNSYLEKVYAKKYKMRKSEINIEEMIQLPSGAKQVFECMENARHSTTVKKLLRDGIPHDYRRHVWLRLAGVDKKLDRNSEKYYQRQLAQELPEVVERQIVADMGRTFSNHRDMMHLGFRESVRSILHAFAARNVRVRYCQGMSHVAAFLLIVLRDEHVAFWLLCAIIEDILPQDYYTSSLVHLRIDQRALGVIAADKLPAITRHFGRLGVEWSMIGTDWFMCLFTKRLPTVACLRIWDLLFSEGSKTLFRVTLGLLKVNERAILATREIDELVRAIDRQTQTYTDADELLRVSLHTLGQFPMARIHTLRKELRTEVVNNWG